MFRILLARALGSGVAGRPGRARVEERPAAPPLEGAGTAPAAWLAHSPRVRQEFSLQSENEQTLILYTFLFKGVIDAF